MGVYHGKEAVYAGGCKDMPYTDIMQLFVIVIRNLKNHY